MSDSPNTATAGAQGPSAEFATPGQQPPTAKLATEGDESTGIHKPLPESTGVHIPRSEERNRPAEADGERLDFLERPAGNVSIGRLAHYKVERVLGEGGFGIVLQAFDEKLQRAVAIKVLNAHAARHAMARERFLREARAAAVIRSPHVVQVFEVAEGPVPYLVMEFVNGPTLQHEIEENGPLDVATIVRIGAQTALGLAAAHAQGRIHRDIKPANILLQVQSAASKRQDDSRDHSSLRTLNSAIAKITDFGLARAVDDVHLTQSGVIAGTPLYMSPEQARGEPLDARSDLFSFGSVLYTLCAGQPAFKADRVVGVLKRVCEDMPAPIQELRPDLPDWLATVIWRLLAKVPAQRFRTAAEVAELLEKYLAHLSDPSLPLPAVPEAVFEAVAHPSNDDPTTVLAGATASPRGPRSRGHWLIRSTIIFAALSCGFLAGYLLRPGQRNSEANAALGPAKAAGPEQARAVLEQALAEQPDNDAVAGALGQLMLSARVGTGGSQPASPAEALRTKLRKAGFSGFAALGAARYVHGDLPGAAESLNRHVAARADASTAELMLQALAEAGQDGREKALHLFPKAMKGIEQRPLDLLAALLDPQALPRLEGNNPAALAPRLQAWAELEELAKLYILVLRDPRSLHHISERAFWFCRRGRWKEAARDRLVQIEVEWKDVQAWWDAAATFLIAGEMDEYREVLAQSGPLIEMPPDVWHTLTVCMIWALIPNDLEKLKPAIQRMEEAEDKKDVPDWMQAWIRVTVALVAYRAGDYERAMRYADKLGPIGVVSPSEINSWRARVTAMSFFVRALVEQKRQHPEEAKRFYDAGAALIPAELRTLGTSAYQGPLPVDRGVIEGDNLMPELIRREAARLLSAGPMK